MSTYPLTANRVVSTTFRETWNYSVSHNKSTWFKQFFTNVKSSSSRYYLGFFGYGYTYGAATRTYLRLESNGNMFSKYPATSNGLTAYSTFTYSYWQSHSSIPYIDMDTNSYTEKAAGKISLYAVASYQTVDDVDSNMRNYLNYLFSTEFAMNSTSSMVQIKESGYSYRLFTTNTGTVTYSIVTSSYRGNNIE